MKTLRLLLPQWQGGMNPNYVLGAELLSVIAPPSSQDEMIKIDVPTNFDAPLATKNGIDRYDELADQTQTVLDVLAQKAPEKVITFGGDCSISQAPFAYLSEKYGDKLGVLWLDAHPDIATPDFSSHLHEMVLANLMGQGAKSFDDKVKRPIDIQKVMYAGLIDKDLRKEERPLVLDKIAYATPSDLKENNQVILDWIKENNIEVLAVHLDLDVLSPYDFRSVYPADPKSTVEAFPAAVGELTLDQVVGIFKDISTQAELVGLSIAEHLPWDAIYLRKAFEKIDIFNS